MHCPLFGTKYNPSGQAHFKVVEFQVKTADIQTVQTFDDVHYLQYYIKTLQLLHNETPTST